MRLLYIGQFTEGTTSQMRGETLKQILNPAAFEVINTHKPFFNSHGIFRSLAFRYKTGPVVWRTNACILQELSGYYDVIWVDKAVFISPNVTCQLKLMTKTLIHYTSNTAFEENQSKAFYKSIDYYDYAIMTKSFVKKIIWHPIPSKKLLSIPQDFDKKIQYPRHDFKDKKRHVNFMGIFEPARVEMISFLLNHDIPVAIAGKKWNKFVAAQTGILLDFLPKSDLISEAIETLILDGTYYLTMRKAAWQFNHNTVSWDAIGDFLVKHINTFYNR